MDLKKHLIKLGQKNKDLRNNIRPVLDHLSKKAAMTEDEAMQAVGRAGLDSSHFDFRAPTPKKGMALHAEVGRSFVVHIDDVGKFWVSIGYNGNDVCNDKFRDLESALEHVKNKLEDLQNSASVLLR